MYGSLGDLKDFPERAKSAAIGFLVGVGLVCLAFGALFLGACFWLGPEGILYPDAGRAEIIKNSLQNPQQQIEEYLTQIEGLIREFQQGGKKALYIGMAMGVFGWVFPSMWSDLMRKSSHSEGEE